MPRGDRTGPTGTGPMTGRRMGLCAGLAAPGYANPGAGRGRFGRGWRHWFHITGLTGWQRAALGCGPWGLGAGGRRSAEDRHEMDLEILKRQAELLEDALDDVRSRIEQLEAETEEEKA
ncbi:MAG TPA: hypothetical protein EYP14_06895 [Planctomycetaceae bacterium]|nr:hypothetical protein [Planctomycetaceae bacterium]